MESRSSESNYEINVSSVASKNRNSSSTSLSSESALESRSSVISPASFSSGSSKYYGLGVGAKKTAQTSNETQKKQYNSLEDIDKLIEKLEASMKTITPTSSRANQILEQKKQKLELLKRLVADARQEEAEKPLIQQLEQDNSELDDAIDSITEGFHK